MLSQCAEFKVTTLFEVVGSQRNDELRYATEPFMLLLLYTGRLPAAGAEHYLFTLTENDTTTLIKSIRRPYKCDVSRVEMEVVLVMEAAVFHQGTAAHPAIDFISGMTAMYGRSFRAMEGMAYVQLILPFPSLAELQQKKAT